MSHERWKFEKATWLDRHADAWDALNRRANGSVLLDSRFVRATLRHFADGRERLAYLPSPSGWRVAAILTQPTAVTWSTFQPSQAPLGTWLQVPSEPSPPLIASLLSALPVHAMLLSLTQQDPAHVARPADDDRLAGLDYIDTARVPVRGEFSAYWAARGSNLRHNLRKARKRLQEAGREVSIDVLEHPADMARGVAEYGAIEAGSWKASEGTAISPDNAQGRFYTDLLETFAASGQARIYRLRIDGAIAASDLCVRTSKELVILKTTFDDRFKEYSPAFLMREEAFERVFKTAECESIEFYGRVMDWHRRWTDDVRTLYHVNHYRWAWVRRRRSPRPLPARSTEKGSSSDPSAADRSSAAAVRRVDP